MNVMDQSWLFDLALGLLCMGLKMFWPWLISLILPLFLQQNLSDGGPWQLQTGLVGMQIHCLDPYGCDGSVIGI